MKKRSQAPHRQVFVKVNAPVDEGVAPLIEALGLFPALETVESCEGNNQRGPWVSFQYGCYWQDSWRPLVDFVLGFLAPELYLMVGDSVRVAIQTTPWPYGELCVRFGATDQVAGALVRLARRTTAGRSRSSGCSGGTSGKAPSCSRVCQGPRR
jgi:hypothetical protein